MNHKRRLALFICVLFFLLLTVSFVHAAQHMGHRHVREGCAVCVQIGAWWSQLNKALCLSFVLLVSGALLHAVTALLWRRRCLFVLSTPVTLKVKITS